MEENQNLLQQLGLTSKEGIAAVRTHTFFLSCFLSYAIFPF